MARKAVRVEGRGLGAWFRLTGGLRQGRGLFSRRANSGRGLRPGRGLPFGAGRAGRGFGLRDVALGACRAERARAVPRSRHFPRGRRCRRGRSCPVRTAA